MAITLKTWTHPATGEVRIYLQGVIGQRGAKVWIAQQAADAFGSDWFIQARADWAADLRGVKNEAAEQIESMYGRKVLFAELQQAAA